MSDSSAPAERELRYQSGDPTALGADERSLLELDTLDPLPAAKDKVAKLVVIVAAGVFLALLVRWSLPERTSWTVLAVLFAAGVVGAILVVTDGRWTKVVPTYTKFTNLRVVQRRPTGVAEVAHELIGSATVRCGADRKAFVTLAAPGRASGDVDVDVDDNFGSIRTGYPENLSVDEQSRTAIVAAVRASLLSGRSERLRWRSLKRGWPPMSARDTPVPVPTSDPSVLAELWLAPIEGEAVLWAGKPARSGRHALRRWRRSLLAAAPWAIAAAAAVASPFFVSWRGKSSWGAASVVAAIIGGLVLVGMFFGVIVEPLTTWRRHGRTRYLLTNLRLVTRVRHGTGFEETSEFYDGDSGVTLTLDEDAGVGIGTVAIGFRHSMESVADAAAVYAIAAIAARAVGRSRQEMASAALPEAQPIE